MFEKRLLRDSVLGTGFIFLLIIIFTKVSQIEKVFGLFDPIGNALNDLEFTDLVFSQLREIPPADTNIVLVNIGELSRAEIAMQVEVLNKYNPKLIGVDVFFDNRKADTIGDRMLAEAFSKVKNLVLVSQAMEYNRENGMWDSLRQSHEIFRHGPSGIANFYTGAHSQEQYKVCRTFPPSLTVKGEQQSAFALKVCEIYAPEKIKNFRKFNHRKEEVINYTRSFNDEWEQTFIGSGYYGIDARDVILEKFDPSLIEGKIVLMGFLGKTFDDPAWEDKFYTPMNRTYAGRSNPDMFGVVIHANIISMLLAGNYVWYQGQISAIITAILICFLNVWFFSWVYWHLPYWYDGLTKIIQLLELFLIILINIYVFHWFSYKTELTITAFAIALAGDSMEVYFGLITNLFSKEGRKDLFRIHRNRRKK